jgi:hypothetical protein
LPQTPGKGPAVEFGASIFFTDYSITPAELAADEGVANGASERGEMLAFIPTGTATNNEFDIDEVNGRHLKLAVTPAIGADIAMTHGKIPYASEQGIRSP